MFRILKRWKFAPWQPACHAKFATREEAEAELTGFVRDFPGRDFLIVHGGLEALEMCRDWAMQKDHEEERRCS